MRVGLVVPVIRDAGKLTLKDSRFGMLTRCRCENATREQATGGQHAQ